MTSPGQQAAAVIAVVVPCYRVVSQIESVLAAIPAEVRHIYCVDDACPDGSGDHIAAACDDPRVRVLRHDRNRGVGGAVITGYRQALADGAEVIVKVDGDGQMDPALLPNFVRPVLEGRCDYTKGNRFFTIEGVAGMPRHRKIGNAVASFLSKASSGYWHLFDPANGYTAIHAKVLRLVPLDKLAERYFFETDMLFRLNTLRCVVLDIPMQARYGDETSSLSLRRTAGPYLWGHARNLVKRLFYNYFLRDFQVASVELVLGLLLTAFGTVVGVEAWYRSFATGVPATAGTVMLSALPLFVGIQFLMSVLHFDVQNEPKTPIHPLL